MSRDGETGATPCKHTRTGWIALVAALVFHVGLLACERPAREAGEGMEDGPALDSGFVRSGEARLFYRAMGEGPPVVVLHGGPGMEQSYLLPGLEPLARDHRLVFYDQRGSGRSAAPLDSASITLDNFLADLDALREALGHGRIALLGHSWGGLLAILYASSRPERVRSMVLMSTIEPGGRFQAETSERQRARQTPEDSAAIARLVRSVAFRNREPGAVSRLYRLTFRSSFSDPDRARELPVDFTERTGRAAGTLPALLLGPVSPYDYWDRLEKITAPTLVVHGEDDPIPPAMARELAATIPDARLVVLENAGHFPFVEAPDPLYEAVREFLGRDGS